MGIKSILTVISILVFALNGFSQPHPGVNGSNSWTKTTHEIRDINKRTKLFSAVSKYVYSGEYLHWEDSVTYSSTSNYSFEYNLEISSNGEIIIDNLITNLVVSEDGSVKNASGFPHYCACLLPDHKEGVYVYAAGSFKAVEKK